MAKGYVGPTLNAIPAVDKREHTVQTEYRELLMSKGLCSLIRDDFKGISVNGLRAATTFLRHYYKESGRRVGLGESLQGCLFVLKSTHRVA